MEEKLASTVGRLWSGRHLRRGTTSVYVVDAATGTPLYAVHQDEPLNPASNVKLVATAAALEVFGPEHRYTTRLIGPAPSLRAHNQKIIVGDVYLLGDYDPTLQVENIQAMAQSVADRGVTHIHGDLYVGLHPWRESIVRPRITVRVQGTAPDQPPMVSVAPASELVKVKLTAITAPRARRSDVSLTMHRIENQLVGNWYELEVAGAIAPGRHRTATYWISHGPELTAHILRQALIDAGVTVTGQIRCAPLNEYLATAGLIHAQPVELARHESKPMTAIVAAINKHSLNRLADRVIMTAAATRYGGEPSMANAVRLMEEWLRSRADVNPGNVVLDTGSGLSYNTELSARQIVNVLRAASGYTSQNPTGLASAEQLPAPSHAATHYARLRAPGKTGTLDVSHGDPASVAESAEAAFVRSLAVGGMDGTLRRRFRRGLGRGRVYGKTGTLTGVIALSGIVALSSDNAVVFAIVSNGQSRRKRGQVRKQHEAMVNAMLDFLVERAQARATSPQP